MNESFLNESVMQGTNWRALERAVARTMSHCGWSDVRIIGRRGDGGGDVIGKRSINGREAVFVVQVKAVTGPHYVGSDAVQEAVDALALYGGDVAVVATNGDFTASAHRRVQQLREHGFDCRLWNGVFLTKLLERWPVDHWEKRHPRPYQEQVIEKAVQKFLSGGRSVQFVVATGLGKSTIASEIVRRLWEYGLRRVLVVCHSQDLTLQLEQSFWTQIGKEVPTHVFFDGLPPKRFEGINFGTYQTLLGYLPGLEPTDFDVVVVDEAHHALANGFLLCLNHLKPRFLVGMTATPWRGDGLDISQVFGEPIAQISLVDGMKMGFLAKVSYRVFCDTIDWKDVFSSTSAKGFSLRDLNRRLFIPQRDEAIIAETLKVAATMDEPRIIFFCSSIEHCARISEMVNLSGMIRCRPLSGVSRIERYKSLMEFSAGRIQAVTAVDVLNEGIDVPDVNIIVFLRVTHSRRIFIQQLGRGLRVSDKKKEVVVLDFVSDLRRIADILELDREARSVVRNSLSSNVYFPDGIVRFENTGILAFVEQWLNDLANATTDQDRDALRFPRGMTNDENS
jgi:superfamily II DNA or RNA helicase